MCSDELLSGTITSPSSLRVLPRPTRTDTRSRRPVFGQTTIRAHCRRRGRLVAPIVVYRLPTSNALELRGVFWASQRSADLHALGVVVVLKHVIPDIKAVYMSYELRGFGAISLPGMAVSSGRRP